MFTHLTQPRTVILTVNCLFFYDFNLDLRGTGVANVVQMNGTVNEAL